MERDFKEKDYRPGFEDNNKEIRISSCIYITMKLGEEFSYSIQ